jgi:hypothetical protein
MINEKSFLKRIRIVNKLMEKGKIDLAIKIILKSHTCEDRIKTEHKIVKEERGYEYQRDIGTTQKMAK